MAANALTVAVSSGKGGVGKTTLAVNLAACLGPSTLLVDGDLGLANVDVALGLEPRHTLKEVTFQGVAPAAALETTPEGFQVLPASSGVPEMAGLGTAEQERLLATLGALARDFRMVLVDTAAGIGPSVLALNRWATVSLVVVTPDPTSLTDAYALVKVLHQRLGRQRFQVVVNNVGSAGEATAVFNHLAGIALRFLGCQLEFLGGIPRDAAFAGALRHRRPLVSLQPASAAGKAMAGVARRLAALAVW